MDTQAQLLGLLQIALAVVMGGVIGFERETAHKPAGLRTHMLVAAAAALLVLLGRTMIAYYQSTVPAEILRTDPIRVIEAVVVGISFLGAGTIFRQEKSNTVHGLTTAASILVTAGVGVAVALYQYWLAVGTTLLILVINQVVGRIGRRVG